MELTPHPALALFPALSDAEYVELREDVSRFGVRGAAYRQGDILLDGRSLLRIGDELGIKVPIREHTGDAIALIASLNLHGRGRQLAPEQRLVIVAQLARMQPGRPRKHGQSTGLSLKQASHLTNESITQNQRVRRIVDNGVPELVEAYTSRRLPASTAAELATKPAAKQRELLERALRQTKAGAKLAIARTPSTPTRASIAQRLTDVDVEALGALAAYGRKGSPQVRAGVKVLERIVPAVGQ